MDFVKALDQFSGSDLRALTDEQLSKLVTLCGHWEQLGKNEQKRRRAEARSRAR
jgi:hypothetical protein